MRNEKWYQRRLAKYFTDHYEIYEDFAEFYPDPGPNQWKFYIPQLGMKIELICNDLGIVHEHKCPATSKD